MIRSYLRRQSRSRVGRKVKESVSFFAVFYVSGNYKTHFSNAVLSSPDALPRLPRNSVSFSIEQIKFVSEENGDIATAEGSAARWRAQAGVR